MGSSPVPAQGTTIPTPGQPLPLQAGEWQPSASPSVVTFRHLDCDPPSAVYVQTGDVLQVCLNVLNNYNDTVTISARLLLPAAPQPGQPDESAGPPPALPPASPAVIQELVLTQAVVGGITQNLSLPLQEGFLLSVGASCAVAIDRGTTFVRCWLQQRSPGVAGVTAAMTLIANYVTASQPIGWPGGTQVFSTDGPGTVVEKIVANPGAGADWSFAAGGNSRIKVLSFSATLTTSATVANRIVRGRILTFLGATAWQGPPNQAITASSSAQVSGTGGQVTSTVDTTTVVVAFPSPLILLPGDTLGMNTLNIQAADQWSQIRLITEQVVEIL